MATLVVNRSDSYCLECPRDSNGCLPWEEGHYTQVGYNPTSPNGCGEPWTAVTSDYVGEGFDNIEEHYFGFENLRGLPVLNRWERND